MESKENNGVFNLAADTIMKWYEQTHTTMVTGKSSSQHDVELMGILLAARKQTLGALTTLTNRHILSTHALLRVIVETFIVLVWALKVPKSEGNTKSEEVYKRLKMWDYARLKKDKALLEDLPRTTEVESAIEKAKAGIERYKKNGIEELPPYKQLYDDVLGEESGEMYAKSYRKYSRAVHLNRNVTQKLAWVQYENEKPEKVLYKDDIDPDGDELLIIASVSSDINKAIRGFYGWQSDAMQNEYEQLKLKLVKK